MTEINNTLYIDNREKHDMQILASILYDDMEVTRLEIGDVLMRGVIFEFKRPSDMVSSIFSGHLFTQIYNMNEHYQYAFLLVSGTFYETEILYNNRAKHPNFPGVVASCIARGCTPLFTDSMENSLKMVDLISKKMTDGKQRDRPVKTTSLKDKQLSIVCSLPGVSETRAKALLEHFGSVGAILDAPEKELIKVKDMGPKTAKKIDKILHKAYIG